MESETAMIGAKPGATGPDFFDLLLQELDLSGEEGLAPFCLKSLSPEEALPAEPWHGPLFNYSSVLPGAGELLASAAAKEPLFSAAVPQGAGEPLVSGSVLPGAGELLAPAAAKEPLFSAAVPKDESEPPQKKSMLIENPDMGNRGSENSGTSRQFHPESGKPPAGELSDFFMRHGEKQQIPSGQAVPEKVAPAVFDAYGGLVQQDSSRFSGGTALLQPDSVLEQVMVRMQHFARPGAEELQIRLYPETLGEMKVKVRSENGLFTAEIIVSHAGVKELLEGQLDQLRQRFKQLNLPVEVINVFVEYSGQEGHPSQGEEEHSYSNNRDVLIIPDNGAGRSRGGAEQHDAHVFEGRAGINVLV